MDSSQRSALRALSVLMIDHRQASITGLFTGHLAKNEQQKHKAKADAILQGALDAMSDIQSAAFNYSPHASMIHTLPDRGRHIQNIFLFQRRKLSSTDFTQEKIALICACMSFSKDFGMFERRSGWTPKTDEVALRIASGKRVAIQTFGKHLNNYVASEDPGGVPRSLQRKNLDAAIRLGTKLEVFDRLAVKAGLPPCLSLLLGFDFVRVSRLNFDAFGCIYETISADDVLRTRIAQFGAVVGDWWAALQKTYEEAFGKGIPVARHGHTTLTHDRAGTAGN
jgi:hypothetical protein